jgi:hypothetical protein
MLILNVKYNLLKNKSRVLPCSLFRNEKHPSFKSSMWHHQSNVLKENML